MEPDVLTATTLPPIPEVRDNNLAETLRAIKEICEVRTGRVGDPLDQAVTFRDLYRAGMLDRSTLTGDMRVRLPGEDGFSFLPAPGGTPEFAPPPAPTGLVAAGALFNVLLTWNAAVYHNHAYTEIWRSGTNDIGTAVRVGTAQGSLHPDPVGVSSASRYYWIRFVSTANVPGPFNATAGTLGTTGLMTGTDLADASVTTAKLADLAVDVTKLADLAVEAAKLADSAVTATKIANLAVGAAAIALLAVGTAHIADAAIITAKIGDAAITSAKIGLLAVDTAYIADAAIVSAKLGDLSVITAKIGDAQITSAKIGSLQVLTAHIADAQITTAKIGSLQVTNAQIANATILGGNIAATTITAANLSVTTLSAISADMGSITAGNITLNATGFIRSGQTAFNTGVGWWIGYDSGVPKLSMGTDAVNRLTWEPSNGLQGRGDIKDTRNYSPGTIPLQVCLAISPVYSLSTFEFCQQIRVVRSGVLTVKFDLSSDGGTPARGRIYKNNSDVGAVRSTTSASWVTFTEDISVSAGDDLQLYADAGPPYSGLPQANVRRFGVYCAFSVNAVVTAAVVAEAYTPPDSGGGSNDSLHPHSEITMADGVTKKWLLDLRPDDMVKGEHGPARVIGMRTGALGDKAYIVINGRSTTTPGHLYPIPGGKWAAPDPACYAECSYGKHKSVKARRGMVTVLSGLCNPSEVQRLVPGMCIWREDGEWEVVRTIERVKHVPENSHTIAVLLEGSKLFYSDGYAVGTLA